MIMTVIVTAFAAYLIGSINFAVIFAKAFLKKDVRDMGSGNAGTTNVMRNAGFLPGALTFVCDVLKGFLACYMGQYVFEYISMIENIIKDGMNKQEIIDGDSSVIASRNIWLYMFYIGI